MACQVRFLMAALLAAGIPAGASAGMGLQQEISRAELGDEWPFTEPAGMLRCELMPFRNRLRPAVTIRFGETWYAVNGAAGDAGVYPSAREKQLRDENGFYPDAGRVIDRGLALCGWPR